MRHNSTGGVRWAALLGGSGYDKAGAVHVDSSDNIYATGAAHMRKAFGVTATLVVGFYMGQVA